MIASERKIFYQTGSINERIRMRRGRPITPLTKKDVQLIVRMEIDKALSQLDIKAALVGTKKKGRPIGFRLKKERTRRTH